MRRDVHVSPDGRCVTIRIAGPVIEGETEGRAELVTDIGLVCRERRCTGLLLDLRAARLRLGVDERLAARSALAAAVGRGLRAAVLMPSADLAADPLLREAASVSGVEYRGFDDEAKARAWLDADTEARSADQ